MSFTSKDVRLNPKRLVRDEKSGTGLRTLKTG